MFISALFNGDTEVFYYIHFYKKEDELRARKCDFIESSVTTPFISIMLLKKFTYNKII